MAKKPVRAGLPTQAVAENLRRLRHQRRLSVRALSSRTYGFLRPRQLDGPPPMDEPFGIPPNGISEIENGLRRVDVDDLIALAVALDVSPAVLLMPNPELPDENGEGVVYLDPADPLDTKHVWNWLTARDSLTTGAMAEGANELESCDDPDFDYEERELWRRRTLPRFARERRGDG
ncbi:helix-turn-helix domain-containing protein [Mycolicibacterium fallax]|nr:helix-turn-helix transcriptional regulator [Mycolicibacterium fallax]